MELLELFDYKKNILKWEDIHETRKAILVNRSEVLYTFTGKDNVLYTQILPLDLFELEEDIFIKRKEIEETEELLAIGTKISDILVEKEGKSIVELSDGSIVISTEESNEFVILRSESLEDYKRNLLGDIYTMFVEDGWRVDKKWNEREKELILSIDLSGNKHRIIVEDILNVGCIIDKIESSLFELTFELYKDNITGKDYIKTSNLHKKFLLKFLNQETLYVF